jgi:hypothetical protein
MIYLKDSKLYLLFFFFDKIKFLDFKIFIFFYDKNLKYIRNTFLDFKNPNPRINNINIYFVKINL